MLILNFFQLPSIDANLFKTLPSTNNGFNKVHKIISSEQTVNIKNFPG